MKFDGYVASGGTEANMQAIWVYRNFFVKEKKQGWMRSQFYVVLIVIIQWQKLQMF